MADNSYTINFQSLKKFLISKECNKPFLITKESNNCEDSKIFGSAYHKILEQDGEKIRLIAQKNNQTELNKLIENFKLNSKDKNLLYIMIKKIYQNPIYQRYVLRAHFIHPEQNLCHFVTNDNYIFRLEAIIDAIISLNSKNKIILDYKTVNNLSLVNHSIEKNFYWIQLLFYKYIYENSVQNKSSSSHEKIDDLYLLFQSKSKSDDYGVVIKKFSDLPVATRKELERNFYLALHDYIKYIIKYKKDGCEIKLPNKSEAEKFRKKNRGFNLISFTKYIFWASIKAMATGCVFGLLWLFYHSQYFIFSERQMECGLIVFIVGGIWFILK